MPSARRDRLGAVANHLATGQQPGDEGMRLVFLKFGVRIDPRIAIIKPGDVTDIHDAVLHAVDPAPAIGPLVGRKAERVRDATRGITIVGQLPELLDPETVNLRLASGIETESLDQFLRE